MLFGDNADIATDLQYGKFDLVEPLQPVLLTRSFHNIIEINARAASPLHPAYPG